RAVLVGGRVDRVVFNRDPIRNETIGHGYTSAPTITFSGGGGNGATAEVTIYQKEEADVDAEEIATQEDFREAIRNERFRELAFETLRKGDLIRWGTYVQTMQRVGDHISEHIQVGQLYVARWYTRASARHL